MVEPNSAGTPPITWRRLIPLAFAVGVGPAIGRDITAEMRESWGYWPAMLAGIFAAGLIAIAVYGVAWLVTRPKDR
jgi:hypothetical protein